MAAVARFLSPTESGHIATKPVCSREGEGESGWEQRLGELSFGAIPPCLQHHSAKQNKELLSPDGSKGKNTGWKNWDD